MGSIQLLRFWKKVNHLKKDLRCYLIFQLTVLLFRSEESIQITSGVFKKHGIYSATAFLEKGQPFEEGLKVLFDFSVDGSPVVPSAYVIPIELKSINDLTTNEETKLAFTAALVNSYRGNETLSFSLGNNFPTGALIDPKSGAFSWTPTESQGPGSYTFDIEIQLESMR